jgi:hypothetical protein
VSSTYTDGRNLREDIKKGHIPQTVVIEATSELLATVLGQRMTGQDGRVISMERLDFHYDPALDRTIASPVFVEVSRGNNPFANPDMD